MNEEKEFPIFEVLAVILQRATICTGGMERVVEFVTGQRRVNPVTMHTCWTAIIGKHPNLMKANIAGFDDTEKLNRWLGEQVAKFGTKIKISRMSFNERRKLEEFLKRSK